MLIAIEMTLGAAVAGPFAIEKAKLEAMIERVMAAPAAATRQARSTSATSRQPRTRAHGDRWLGQLCAYIASFVITAFQCRRMADVRVPARRPVDGHDLHERLDAVECSPPYTLNASHTISPLPSPYAAARRPEVHPEQRDAELLVHGDDAVAEARVLVISWPLMSSQDGGRSVQPLPAIEPSVLEPIQRRRRRARSPRTKLPTSSPPGKLASLIASARELRAAVRHGPEHRGIRRLEPVDREDGALFSASRHLRLDLGDLSRWPPSAGASASQARRPPRPQPETPRRPARRRECRDGTAGSSTPCFHRPSPSFMSTVSSVNRTSAASGSRPACARPSRSDTA